MGSVEDSCIVCAEPLHFTAFGPCQHKETCSNCIVRLRTLLNNNTKCVYCSQDCPSVFVTRYMGDYTCTVSPSDFDKLEVSVSETIKMLLDRYTIPMLHFTRFFSRSTAPSARQHRPVQKLESFST